MLYYFNLLKSNHCTSLSFLKILYPYESSLSYFQWEFIAFHLQVNMFALFSIFSIYYCGSLAAHHGEGRFHVTHPLKVWGHAHRPAQDGQVL